MRKQLLLVCIASIIALSGCAGQQSESKGNIDSELVNIKQLVNDYSAGNIEDQSASINSTQLIVTKQDNSQLTYALPKDEFFVSIAPYIEQTHPCATHSLTGCQGELMNEEFEIYIEDHEGNVIRDETITSNSHGFIDLWLPRDQEYRITITQNGKTVKSDFSTFESDDTCITTMQLA
ncbi:CueP family metal-binding protein [Paenibacillus sp. GM2]|uniref:CueP family metal-binding protein n=1 Tax=Paenibacillus sp. GM2 TaxID=1622070 RepID=UPI0008391285|nr:CueP family metal-binding protein [Paenibacillus sp. GM2]